MLPNVACENLSLLIDICQEILHSIVQSFVKFTKTIIKHITYKKHPFRVSIRVKKYCKIRTSEEKLSWKKYFCCVLINKALMKPLKITNHLKPYSSEIAFWNSQNVHLFGLRKIFSTL